MRQISLIIICLLILSNFGNAFAFSEFFSGSLEDLVTGNAVRNVPPKSNANFPANNVVVNLNPAMFTWKTSDPENDVIQAYEIQVSDNFNFVDPIVQYVVKDQSAKIYLGKGDVIYYWRVKARDEFDWGDWSDTVSFTLDSSVKICNDGTAFFKCSENEPMFCDSGNLVDDCKKCGCKLNSKCLANGICEKFTCSDGTDYGACSKINPNFCQDGVLKEVCSLCGCDQGYECKSDGSCSKTVVVISDEKPPIISEDLKSRNLLEFIIDFFKSFFKKKV